MKKLLFVSSIFLLSLFANFAFAQAPTQVQSTSTVSQIVTVANVDFLGQKILSQNGRTFSISFFLTNGVGAQPQVKYATELMTKSSSGQWTAVDTHVYSDTVSLAQDQTIQKTVQYIVPNSVPAGTYHLGLFSKNSNGLIFAFVDLGPVVITPTTEPYVQIIPNSCYFTIAGNTTHYTTNAPVTATSTLAAHCIIQSTFSGTVNLLPEFQTKINSSFGANVQMAGISSALTAIVPGTHTMTFSMPVATLPQNYDVDFSIVSRNGTLQSNTVSFGYSISGTAGTIENVVFDKSYYSAGDTASVQVFVLSSVPTSTVSINIKNNLGIACASEKIQNISEPVSTIMIPITHDCLDPQAHVILSANGIQLDVQGYSITSSQAEIASSTATEGMASKMGEIILLILILLFMFIAFIFYFFKKHQDKKLSSVFGTMLLLICVSLFGISGVAKAATVNYNYSDSWSGGCCGYTVSYDFMYTIPATLASSTTQVPVSVDTTSSYNFSNYQPAVVIAVFNGIDNQSPLNDFLFGECIDLPSANPNSCNNVSGSYTDTVPPLSPGTHTINLANIALTDDKPDAAESYWGFIDSNGTLHTWPGLKITAANGGVSPTFSILVPTATINASPNPVADDATTTLTWNTANVSSCSINGVSVEGSSSPVLYQYLSSYGSYGVGNESLLNHLNYIAINNTSGNIYVTDQGNNRVVVFNSSGSFLFSVGSLGSANGQFNAPNGIAINQSTGNFYVADQNNNRVEEFDASGAYLTSIYGYDSPYGGFTNPQGIAVDSSGNVYVADDIYTVSNQSISGNTYGTFSVVQKFNSSGSYVSTMGLYTTTIPNGLSSSIQTESLTNASSVAVSAAGNIYVTDYGAKDVVEFNSSGNNANAVFTGGVTVAAGNVTITINGTTVSASGSGFTSAASALITKINAASVGGVTATASSTNASAIVLSNSAGTTITSGTGTTLSGLANPTGSVLLPPQSGSLASQSGLGAAFIGFTGGPTGIVINSAGYIYVADSGSNQIRVFSTSTSNSTAAFGSATLNYPQSLALDASGNLYISNSGNDTIQKYNPGSPSLSPASWVFCANNSNQTCSFGGTEEVEFGVNSGWDYGTFSNKAICNLTQNGGSFSPDPDPGVNKSCYYYTQTVSVSSATYISSFGSAGSNAAGEFSGPYGIAQYPANSSGNFYITDQNNNRVEEFTSTGTYVNQFGTPGSGNGQFNAPLGITVDSSGNMYVVDQGNNRVEEFTSTGTYVNQFGTPGSGNGQFSSPVGIVFDPISGYIYVADTANNRIEEFSSTGNYEGQFGSRGSGNGQLNNPFNLAVDSSGNIYVTDNANNRVEEFSSTGTYVNQFSGSGQFSNIRGIAVDSSGNIYVTDTGNNDVSELANNGSYLNQFNSTGTSTLSTPSGIIFDGSGNIDVADFGNNRIVTFTQSNVSLPISGSMQTSNLTSNTTFTLSCTGSYGSISASTTIDISPNSCPKGEIYNSTTGQCLAQPSCPGSIYNPGISACCPVGETEIVGGSCETELPPQSCPANQMSNGNGECVCTDNGSVPNADGSCPGITPLGNGLCTLIPSQTMGSSNVYVNKEMTWNVSLPVGVTSEPPVSWSGTNVLQSVQTSSSSWNTIYTKVGSTTVSVSLLGSDGNNYVCSTSTVIRAGTATVNNI